MGQSFSLAHLAPFVNDSREIYIKQAVNDFTSFNGREPNGEHEWKKIRDVAEKKVIKEITAGIQTIQYQLITIMTTNGWCSGRFKISLTMPMGVC